MNSSLAFHIWLKQARIALDLGRTDLARQAGCSLAMIRQLEYGKRRPSRELAERLARYLQIAGEDRDAFLRAARTPVHDQPAAHKGSAGRNEPSPNGLAGTRAPLDPEGRLARLPPLPSDLIGRAAELAAARAILAEPATRLLTLIGPGGVGKTHFGLQLASEIGQHFADGVFFIPLAPINDPALLPIAVAQALDLRAVKNEPTLDRLIDALGDREILLFLDNAEHLTAAAPLLGSLLNDCPRLRLLVTSRSPLRLHLEQQFVVPPLPVPDASIASAAAQGGPVPHGVPRAHGETRDPDAPAAGGADIEALADYASIQLFVSRARLAQPSFKLGDDNAAAVAEICRQLDGLPLAIELAAARVRGLPPQAMLARLSDRLDLLTGGSADLPARHQTLRKLIDWSYHLLSTEEQSLFRRLAVFVGHWTLEAAEEVCVLPGEPTAAVMNNVLALLDKSLLREDHRGDGGAAFAMLEVIRDYARERLADAGEEAAFRSRHASHYLTLARAAESGMVSPEQQHWLDRLSWERDNIRAALDWLLQQNDAETALELIGFLWKFWQIRNYWGEGLRWIEAALALPARRAPSYLAARTKVLWGAGWLAVEQRKQVLARTMFNESLALARGSDDRRGIARALHGVGLLAEWEGSFKYAMACYEESLALFRELDDTEEIAWSLRHLAAALQAQGQAAASLALAEEALEVFRSIGHQWGIVHQTMTLAHTFIEQGDHSRAAGLLNESLSLARSEGYQHLVVELLRHLGRAAQDQGRYAEAREHFGESLALARGIREGSGIRWGVIHLGHIAILEGQLQEAQERLLQILPEVRRHEPPWAVAWLEAKLGRIALEQGELALALERYTGSLSLYHQHDLRWGIAECLEGIAATLAADPAHGESAAAAAPAPPPTSGFPTSGLGAPWATSGYATRIAQILGAADQLRKSLNRIRPLPERAQYEAARDWARSRLAERAFEAAWKQGGAMPLAQAIVLATLPTSAADARGTGAAGSR